MEQIATPEQTKRAIESIKWLKKVKVLKIIFRFYDQWEIHFGIEKNNPYPMEIIYVELNTNQIRNFKPYCSIRHGYAPDLLEWIYKGKNTDF